MIRRFAGALALAAIAAPGCRDEATRPSDATLFSRPSGPAAIAAYLGEVVRTMEAQSANAPSIDWPTVRVEVLAAAANAQTLPDAYPAIDLALRRLNDFESHYRSTTGTLIGPSPEPGCTPSPATVPPLPESIGYVRVSGCLCQSDAQVTEYAEALQAAIRDADRPGLAGWIVDLREDGGGNMWPMIAGLGPILGEGIMGWIVYNNREYEREYRNGEAMSFGDTFAKVADPYTLREPSPKVAVLTGGGTNSAGEAIAVWFKNRPNTRAFGTPTCGHHHLLAEFQLSDGALLTLKDANNADRLKHAYAGPIAPDDLTAPDDAAALAIAWLQSGT